MNIVKKYAKLFKSSLSRLWSTASVYHSFYKRHKNIYMNGEFKKTLLTRKQKKEYLSYWRKVNVLASTKTVELCKSLSGEYNEKIIPEEVFALNIEKHLVPRTEVAFLENKSFYEKWFGGSIFPTTYFHKIDNVYYDAELQVINNIHNFIKFCPMSFPLVFKPSVDSYGGENVFFLNSKEEFKELLPGFSNVVCQEKIIQSELINNIYSGSINTVRVCLLKPLGSSFKVINCSLRMGKDGGLDNETAGGIVCSLSDKGEFNEHAIDKHGVKYLEHPNSRFCFYKNVLPLYDELVEISESIADKIPQTRLVSLDMCLDAENNWRCIEVNLLGQTIRFAQYAGKPFLGEFTDSIYEEILGINNVR